MFDSIIGESYIVFILGWMIIDDVILIYEFFKEIYFF